MVELTAMQVADIAKTVGVEVAGPAAAEVDRDARFPSEAVDALRDRGLLSALVPTELGGGGASMVEVTRAVRELANHCSAAALVYAMHSVEVAILARHGTTESLRGLLREIASEQLLIANANSEVGTGGDVGRSVCAVTPNPDGGPTLTKEALAISYGAHADLIVATARRSPEGEATDQVLAVCRDFELEALSDWDAIGLRGTCSRSFRLRARLDPELIYPAPFAALGSDGGLQAVLLFLSATWVGIAESAGSTAHAHVRAAARRTIGSVPRSALRLAELSAELDGLRARLQMAAERVQNAEGDAEFDSLSLLSTLRNLKVAASQGAVTVVGQALAICGIAGYRRDTPSSLDRQLRDVHGGLVMVSNDRYLHANAEALIARKQL